MKKDEIFNILYGIDNWDTYHQFQELERMIDNSDYLYQYFNEIKEMLINEKAYIRVRGFRIISKLAKYDKENKVNENIDFILKKLDDNKPTAVRQYINSLENFILYKPELIEKIKGKLIQIDYSKYKDSMSPLIKRDIDNILKGC